MSGRFKKVETVEVRARIDAGLKLRCESIIKELNYKSFSALVEHALLIFEEEFERDKKESNHESV